MDNLLDYIVSVKWVFMVVFIGLSLIPTLMVIRRPFKNLIAARATQIGVSAGVFALLMYLIMGPHGYAVSFISGLTNGKDLILVEKHFQGDGDGGSWETYRLYVLDLKTGKRTLRMNLDSPDLLCASDSSVFFFDWGGKAIEYSLHDGNAINELGIETGFENFPELNTGISSINRSKSNEFVNDAWLTIQANDGHHYCYNILEKDLVEREYPPMNDGWGFDMSEHTIYYRDPIDTRQWSFDFETKTGEIQSLVYHAKDYSTKQFDGEFLAPKFVVLNSKHRFFIIQHYQTLERKESILTAINFDLKPIWRIEQNTIASKDNFTENPEAGLVFAHQDLLIATFGGTAVCLNILTGEVIWKSVL